MPFRSFMGGFLLVVLALGPVGSASASVLISVDKSSQRISVSLDGRPLHSWPVSTGRAGFETPSGAFRPFRLEKEHYSREWDDAPMPHSIFFTARGHAIHGSGETRRLGRRASHGCIRLAPRNAATLFALVSSEGLGNTKVVVSERASTAEPKRALRKNAARPPTLGSRTRAYPARSRWESGWETDTFDDDPEVPMFR